MMMMMMMVVVVMMVIKLIIMRDITFYSATVSSCQFHCLPTMPNASALLDLPVTVCGFKVILIIWLNGVMLGRWLLTWINAHFA